MGLMDVLNGMQNGPHGQRGPSTGGGMYSGLSRQDLLDGLRQHLPEVIDQLTPNGRLPTEQELSQSV
jgi:hypothetical protein